MLYQLKKGWQVLDIGANRGLWTREAVQAGCTVVACEPIAKYRQTILDAGASVVLPVAVSDIEDQVTFTIGQDDRFSSVHAEWVREADSAFGWGHVFEKIEIDTMRLDHIITVYGPFDFIKIDSEGHEPSIIRSMGGIKPPRLSFEYHGSKCQLQSMRQSSDEAVQLLGTEYMYRFAAESRRWATSWVESASALDLLDGLNWGDVIAIRKDIFELEQLANSNN
jgi:FkbM family methyltransferase